MLQFNLYSRLFFFIRKRKLKMGKMNENEYIPKIGERMGGIL